MGTILFRPTNKIIIYNYMKFVCFFDNFEKIDFFRKSLDSADLKNKKCAKYSAKCTYLNKKSRNKFLWKHKFRHVFFVIRKFNIFWHLTKPFFKEMK